MNKYKIEIIEKLTKTIEIEANSYTEAISNVEELYKNEKVILYSSDYVTTDIDISTNDESFKILLGDEKFLNFILMNAEKAIENLSNEELAILAFGSISNAKEEFEIDKSNKS